jgi:hypothetical protein
VIGRASIASLALFLSSASATIADSPQDLAYFESHIRPALIKHCYECHSSKAEKLKGGLRLDHKNGWKEGGDLGSEISPGHPEASRLIEAIRYGNPELEMPPNGKLPKELIGHFEEWIHRGAPDPREEALPITPKAGIDLAEGRKFWSFQPISNPVPPTIADSPWPQGTIDQFILREIRDKDLSPSADATPEALLRRLHYDLTGLPPTPAEINQFISDCSSNQPAAIEKKVDDLLADSGFGERWGRHWLDLARYSDSTGGGRAIPLPEAWRYRNYVLDSFNADRPLDDLIRAHLAGDLLPFATEQERLQQLTATGFLVLGPHNYENQDKELLELEIVDEQLDTIGRSFLGMTIGCARCHDHKFDPIPAADYYSLAGIFTSTTSVKHSNVSSWHQETIPPSAEQQGLIAAIEKESAPLKEQIKLLSARLKGDPKPIPTKSQDLPGLVIDDQDAKLVGDWMQSISNPHWVNAGYIHDKSEGKGLKSVTFPILVPKDGSYEVRISWSHGTNRAHNTPVTVKHRDGTETIAVDQRKKPSSDGLFHPLGHFHFEAGVKSSVSISTKGTTGAVIVDAVQLIPAGTKPADQVPKKKPLSEPDTATAKKELQSLTTKLKALESRLPKTGQIMCVTDAPKPENTQIRLRGLPRRFGAKVPRGFLQATLPANSPPPTIEQGSGRLELANWITSPGNPLPARVLANRIWLHLFGQGLVRTPDNFGLTGELPTHPALLDHLAQELKANNWSTKALVRRIVLSRTYQLSTRPRDEALAHDPENRLLSHANRRTLDAESLRDTILLLAGTLDRSKGGPSLPRGFKSEFNFEVTTRKRSVYVPVFRNALYELFATFDFANPNFTVGQRSQSAIPTQALFLRNSPFIHTHAKAAAERLLAEGNLTPGQRLDALYLRSLGRSPSTEERAHSERFLREYSTQPSDPDAWAALQRALFCSLDFRYLP